MLVECGLHFGGDVVVILAQLKKEGKAHSFESSDIKKAIE